MTNGNVKLEYDVTAERVDAHGSLARCKDAVVTLDTDLAGRRDAMNPAELLLTALAACMLKGIERIAPMLKFELRGVRVSLHGVRQDVPPRLESISYEIFVDSDETDEHAESPRLARHLPGPLLWYVPLSTLPRERGTAHRRRILDSPSQRAWRRRG